MATVNIMKNVRSQTRAGLAFILAYCKRDAKTQYESKKLVTGINCVAASAYREMMNTKLQYGKADGRMFYHLVQSFSPEERIAPETAHEIAVRFASKQFSGFEVLVATHMDKHHVHSHFVVNSVSCEDGRKLHADKEFLPRLREASDRLCMEYGLSVVGPKKKSRRTEQMSSREYRAADRGESWKLRLVVTVEEAMAAARTREEFIRMMEAEGYSVRWTPERKYITYTTPDGQRCRDNKLHEEKFLNENMENEFRIRYEVFGGAEESGEKESPYGRAGTALRGSDGAQLESDDRHTESAACYADAAHGYDAGAGYEDRDREIPGASARSADGADGEQLYDHRGISNDDETGVGRIYRLDENGDLRFVETGWENERELLGESLNSEGYDEELYEEDLLDHGDPIGGHGHLLSDAAYLAADLSNLLDDGRQIEDSTTLPQARKQRKKKEQGHGPVMGGM